MSEREPAFKQRIGEIRPSQLMFTYGIGAVIDLPKISVLVAGLEDWTDRPQYARPISEERLLAAVRHRLPRVERLLAAPVAPERGPTPDPFGAEARIGVGAITFPRWLLCPLCRTLAPLSSGLFELKHNPYHPDRSAYRHVNCNKARTPPEAVPARFLVACERGHLDDFPWLPYVHREQGCASPSLSLVELGPGGEVSSMLVRCTSCGQQRSLAEAFDPDRREQLPLCRGRRPHLRDYDPEGCEQHVRPLILGASNTWFPSVISALAVPVESGKLEQAVLEQWAVLQTVTHPSGVQLMRTLGRLGALEPYTDEAIWSAIEARQQALAGGEDEGDREPPDIKSPEWQVFTQVDASRNGPDFKLRPVRPPRRFTDLVEQVVLAERLREVRAMLGFTRLDSLGDLEERGEAQAIQVAPLSRREPTWVPANEVRGEGIFIQLREDRIRDWETRPAVRERALLFGASHAAWRKARRIEPAEEGFPGMRYLLIHSLAHLLMRQLALEAGYAAPSIRERIYARPPGEDQDPMAGLLIYTAAPDSEGTLGGLVELGRPENLERHLEQALETARLCANDPLCAERPPDLQGRTLHAASCHACGFAPETSCERGNKYLDRSLVVPTIEREDLALFAR